MPAHDRMTYQKRLAAAFQQIPPGDSRGQVSRVDVAHDAWCGIYKGRPCNCDPDVTLGTQTGTYMVDRRGHATPRKA